MSFSLFLAHVCSVERRAIHPGSGQGIQVGSVLCLSPWGCTVLWVQSGISGKHTAMPMALTWGSGGRIGRVSPRVIFLKSHQARQLPSETLCCLEQKTQALGHYLGPLHTAFSLISPPKYLRAGGKSEPPPKALTFLWRSFPLKYLPSLIPVTARRGQPRESKSLCHRPLWCLPG